MMKRPAKSILEPMLNLECSDGHRYYSPTPNRWRGQTCKPYRNVDGERCERKLRRITVKPADLGRNPMRGISNIEVLSTWPEEGK